MSSAGRVLDIAFRPALDQDRAFLFGVYASSRAGELAPLPWTTEQKQAFLEQQFGAQDHHYKTYYGDADFLIVQLNGQDSGRLYVHRTPGEIVVIDITLLPERQRQGAGTRIMKDLVAESDLVGCSLSLHVEAHNPALRLYQRLGFQRAEDVGVYVRMVRPAEPCRSGASS